MSNHRFGYFLREGLRNKFRFIQAEADFFACAFGSDDANSLMRYDYDYIYRFYSDIITRKTHRPLEPDIAFLLEMYCRGSILSLIHISEPTRH